MSYDWNRDWIPHDTKQWPAEPLKRGMMVMFAMQLTFTWGSDVCYGSHRRIKESTSVAEIKILLRRLLGDEGVDWWMAPIDWNKSIHYVDIFTRSEHWVANAMLIDDKWCRRVLNRITLIQERQEP